MKLIPQTEEGLASLFPCEGRGDRYGKPLREVRCKNNATREVENAQGERLIVCEDHLFYYCAAGWHETEESKGEA